MLMMGKLEVQLCHNSQLGGLEPFIGYKYKAGQHKMVHSIGKKTKCISATQN